jgi:crotonobetainyl-CoA:carnitine CoA-transferase CaiB-like acyl-CoA transferase
MPAVVAVFQEAKVTNSGSNDAAPKGLLDGVRVVDLTHYFSGPYCTKLLATLGADVIKIERPGSGDPMRSLGPFASALMPKATAGQGQRSTHDEREENGAWFLYLNTSKKSLTLDLKSDDGKRVLRDLVASSQILVENFAPGVLDRLALGYDELRSVNPELVMTSISNYGQTGPRRDWKAAEINLYAAGGLMNITGEPEYEPLKEGAPLSQLGAGQNAFVASMVGLIHAEDSGEGQHIDISIAEYATNILENAMMQYSYSGQEYTRVGNRGYGRAAWGIYPCQDGYVGIIAGPDQRWPEVAEIMEREELADPRFASRYGRLVHADEVDALMLPWLLDHDKVDVFKAGQEHGLAFTFVATMEDLLEMEQLTARDYFVELDHPVTGPLQYPGSPISPATRSDAWVYRRAPLLGEHTNEILEYRLGYSTDQIMRLRDQGVI